MRRLTIAALLLVVASASAWQWPAWLRLGRVEDKPTWQQWSLHSDWVYLGTNDTSDIITPADSGLRWFDRFRDGAPEAVPCLPWSEFWAFAMADSWGATPAFNVAFQYRWRTWNPRYPALKFYGEWVDVWRSITVTDSLYCATLWADDSLGWFADQQYRAIGTASNDSVKVRFWVGRRTWR